MQHEAPAVPGPAALEHPPHACGGSRIRSAAATTSSCQQVETDIRRRLIDVMPWPSRNGRHVITLRANRSSPMDGIASASARRDSRAWSPCAAALGFGGQRLVTALGAPPPPATRPLGPSLGARVLPLPAASASVGASARCRAAPLSSCARAARTASSTRRSLRFANDAERRRFKHHLCHNSPRGRIGIAICVLDVSFCSASVIGDALRLTMNSVAIHAVHS